MVNRSLNVDNDPFRPCEDNEEILGPEIPYMSAIGGLMYLANCTRPDIAFATNLLARYNSSPTHRHWKGIKHIFRYLQGTIDLGLFYPRNSAFGLVGFADAGYLSDPHKSRSQTGYVFTIGGTAISWRSQKQTLVATSSNHAEMIALHEACRECMWLRSMTNHKQEASGIASGKEPTILFEDNAACVAQIKEGYIKSDKTKHIPPRFFSYTQELEKNKEVDIQYIRSSDNAADLFTKMGSFSTPQRQQDEYQNQNDDESERSEDDVVQPTHESGNKRKGHCDTSGKSKAKKKGTSSSSRSWKQLDICKEYQVWKDSNAQSQHILNPVGNSGRENFSFKASKPIPTTSLFSDSTVRSRQSRRKVTTILHSRPVMASSTALISDTEAWKDLKGHVEDIKKTHLRDLMSDANRCQSMMMEFDGLLLDYSRQCATVATVDKLLNLAKAAQLTEKISRMFNGEHINSTENRSVLHVALRAPKDAVIKADGKNVVPEVWNVLDKIKEFSEKIRSGSWVGATGKPLKDVIAIGIGGSFLGPLFVHTALQTDPEALESAKGRQLRFLANIDPVDVARNIKGLNPETTLVVVVSKTFTTAETMLNARTLREWITAALGASAVAKHMVAVSTNLALVEKFGIDPNNAFAFWDWVGGRYSVCSAVGVLPLSLQYGFSVVEKFLKGASSIDQHFQSTPFEKNIPVLLGLLSVWNVSFLGYPARAILPYSQALEKFAPHIQQVSMESNGKGVSIDGLPLPFETGEIDFGEPGTNGQHSFYQLIHQGRVIPCDFIGIVKSQQPVYLKGEVVSNHDELMSNFFAQPDALAYGKTPEQLQKENVSENLIPHKTFSGNRPSLSLLLPELTAYNVGQLLAIYEHRVAVQGFVWGINSFDQWGVELGKVLATQVRKQLHSSRTQGTALEGFNYSTTTLLKRYLETSSEPQM
ncbi:Phosphoglucose isomerase (PGI) [Arabidopsis thaliana x Arabidopsis arenosa]|uniref:Glucose-6-phosphate isomerase, cytosolic n=1 Tax=Arabidopsis thaliana x Arabidopsis arenosa TaxID=1240361 RepID=A0A8T1XNX1_9BRAS|nr:Phosphoglucose isomerase (PGI) [Arabidopsis thaliana x Arabidopsis arenosa]